MIFGGIRLLSIAIAFSASAAIETAGEWAESASIRFESRDWAADAMAGAQGNASIAIEGGRLQSNAIWAPPATHLVLNTVYVPSGITLTIATNCVVKFCPGTTIKVEDGGNLNIAGSDGGDVILTAANDATVGEAIAGFEEEQPIAFDGIRLQSSAASFTDNGWLETRGFDYGAFPGVSVNATEAVRNGGMAYVPFTLSGSSRDKAFSVEWEAVAGTARYGDDYTLASGRISWNKSGDGTKTLAIPLNTANITGEERTFTVRIKAARCANVVCREATVKIVERDGLTLEWADEWAESAPPIRFESREWAEPVMAGATNNAAIAIEGGRLQSNAVWNASSTHLVLNTVFVPSGITLTITAGAVVKYCPGTSIKVEDGGKLVVNGADGNDVILTAANDATVGEAIAGFDVEQSIAFDGIRLQSSAATFTDNGWLETRGFTWGSYPSVSLNDSTAFRSAGEALLPVTVGGTTRNQSFTVDWEAIDGTAKLGEDYTLASGRITWAKSGDGTKTLRIPLVADHLVGSNTEFKVRLTVSRGANIARGECTVTIKELDTLDLAWGEAESNPPIRFESREWMEPVLAGVANSQSIAIEGGRLQSNAVWNASVTHLVLNDVIVPSGITLTITAGAVVKYGPGTAIKVEDGGKLVVNGADGNDVILTAANDATAGEPIAGFDAEQSIAFDGIRLQSSSASFTDNGWLETRGFTYGTYPTLTIHDATANRKVGMIYLPVTVSGSRNQAFTVDWATEDETAQFGRDYTTSNAGRLTWSKTGDGTKYITIPLAKDVVTGTNRTFKVKFVTARCCNVSRDEAVATIAEFENGGIESYDVVEWTPSESSAEFPVNEGIKTQPMFLKSTETIQYSGKWQPYDENEAAVLRVTLETDNGATVLKEVAPSETGAFDLNLKQYPVGYYTLKHEILNDLGETLATMQKTFSIADDEDVVLHGGVLASNEVWAADKVHVVYETVVVPSIYTIFIEPGAIVKFMTGTGIDISQGGAFFANRIVFTHINDDTVGGDTLNDGFTVAPPMDAYFLSGAFTFGDDTELRGITQNNALTGTIATQKTLSRGSTYRVSGTLTIASGGSLTIPPGTVLKMEDKAAIVVNSGATLNAVGTRAAPITFTSIKDDTISGDTNGDGSNTIPQPGDWEEIKNNGGTMNLAFVTALYGGYGQYANQGDAIIRTANGETKMDCCVVKHSNLRLVGRTGGTVYAENCILEDGRWGIDGAVTFVNGVIANCNTGANGATLKNSILWVCDTYASGGTASNCVAYGEITTVQTGMTYADPLFVDPVNGDFRVKEGSPCVDAADGAVAPELDFYGQPRITITDHGDELVGQLADIGVCEVMPRDVVSDIDLVPQSVRTTTNAVPGQLLFVKWEIANVGGREVDAAWRDTVSLVSESGREVVLGVKTTSSRIGVGGSVFCSGYFTVPAIAEGTWYPKVNVNSYHDIFEGSLSANNALTGERAVSVGLEALDPSISREGVINGGTPTVLKLAFGENDDNRMVKFDVPTGVIATWGFGFMPGGTRSSASGSMTASGDGVMFRVPDGAADVYVILESDTTTTYNLSTESTQMTITGVTPATLPSSGTTTLTITGAGFGETNALSLISSAGRVALNVPQKDASGNLVATIDCATLTAGQTYSIRVESGENAAELQGAVTVTKVEGKGHFWARLVVPESVRQGRKCTCYVEYGNDGNADIPCQVVQVSVEGDGRLSLDDRRFSSIVQFVAVGNNPNVGVLVAGASARMYFNLLAGAANIITMAQSYESDFAPPPWNDAEGYLLDLSSAATRLAMRGDDGSDYDAAFRLARQLHDGTACAVVSGTVMSSDGLALQGITLFMTNELATLSAVVDADGHFSFGTVTAGRYTLYAPLFSWQIGDIEVGNGSEDVSIAAVRDCPSQVTIRLAGDDVLPNDIVVTAVSVDGWPTNAITGVRIGLDEVRFWGLEDGLYEFKAVGSGLCGNLVATVSAGMLSESESVLDLEKSYSINGTVDLSSTFEDMAVYAIGKRRIYRATVEDDGTFAFGSVVADKYRLLVVGSESDVYESLSVMVPGETEANPVVQFAARSKRSARLFGTSPSSGDYDRYAFWEMRQLARHLKEQAELLHTVKIIPDPPVYCRENLATYQHYLEVRREFGLWLDWYRESYARYSQTSGADVAKEAAYLIAEVIAAFADLHGTGDYWMSIVSEAENLIDSALAAELGISTVTYATVVQSINDSMAELEEALRIIQSLDFANDSVWTTGDKIASIFAALSNAASGFERIKSFGHILSAAAAKKKASTRLSAMAREFKWQHTQALGFLGVIRSGLSLYKRAKSASEKLFTYFYFEIEGLRNAANFFRPIYDRYSAFRFDGYHTDCEKPIPDPPYDPYWRLVPIVPQSCDPNEMSGPLGLGNPETERFVKPGEELTYTIYFENKTNATAAAQEVYVTNSLSQYLDWSTFKMHEVAFGDQIDLGLVDKSSGTSEVTMKGTNFVVRTELVLEENGDAGTRDACPYQAKWYMRIVDPTTDTGWPTDIVAGFLPPNDETHRGEGHITYSICVREDAPANLVISNSADIVFDHNPSIKTDPAWWNTVAPTTGNAKFNEAIVETEEGSNAVIRVMGGNLYTASSVKVYLTYNTAAAADVDVAKGTVSSTGSLPVQEGNAQAARSTGLKFPLALTWEKGEMGEKVITIPVKTDKTVEGDEFFTLQLAEAEGMELGEERVCTVTIHDPGYEELAAKFAAGTATKAEQTAWDKLQKAKAPYIRGLADPADGGKVTGSGLCAAGKKVTLKATANKGFVFTGWCQGTGNGEQGTGMPGFDERLQNGAVEYVATTPSLVIDRSAKPAKDSATSTTITNVNEDATFYACFITSAEDKAAVAASVDGLTLDPWVSKTETHAFTTNIWAGVYLEWPVAASALSATTIKVAGLPAGLKFVDKPVTSKIGTGRNAVTITNVQANTIYGAPTAASKMKNGAYVPSTVKVTVTTAGKSTQTYQIDATVLPLPAWAQGTFAGGEVKGRRKKEEGISEEDEFIGQVSLTVDAKGKVSGKALGDGLTYTLAAPYYSAFEAVDDGEGVASNFLADVTASWSYKEGSKTIKTNDVVQFIVQDNAIGGVATGGGGFVETALPEWTAWQYNWKVAPWKDVGTKFNNVTQTYAILSSGECSEDKDDIEAALGADVIGRVTLKFKATGAVSVSGEFVSGAYNDKTKKYPTVKATGSATLVPVDEEYGAVFIYLTPKGLSPHVRCLNVPWPE